MGWVGCNVPFRVQHDSKREVLEPHFPSNLFELKGV